MDGRSISDLRLLLRQPLGVTFASAAVLVSLRNGCLFADKFGAASGASARSIALLAVRRTFLPTTTPSDCRERPPRARSSKKDPLRNTRRKRLGVCGFGYLLRSRLYLFSLVRNTVVSTRRLLIAFSLTSG